MPETESNVIAIEQTRGDRLQSKTKAGSFIIVTDHCNRSQCPPLLFSSQDNKIPPSLSHIYSEASR